jgi:hypothetical protein
VSTVWHLQQRTRTIRAVSCTLLQRFTSFTACKDHVEISLKISLTETRGVIKYAWNTILDKGNTTLDHIYPGMEDAPEDESYTIGSHFSHCVEIVRQALECYADPTLEPLLTDTGDHSALLASGWGTKHTCRNFEKLTEWVDAPISD